MLKVGLTGGIACGKSHVLRGFQNLGVYTIDADEIAHQVILPGKAAYKKIVHTFGHGILAPDQTIDRKKLGKLVFFDEEARQELNRIVHPFVLEEEERLMSNFGTAKDPKSPMVMVDAALMVETGSYRKYDFLIVVYCDSLIQLRRLMSRESLSQEEAMRRIRTQMPLSEKVKHADYIVDNSGRLSDTKEQIKQIFTELVKKEGPCL
ncbi:dephospho-CoA kinase [Acidobacteria bacterium AH-259-A15]|nr:dephospho-CoA kinase [Acidobacteria bacterium AH-259-A15]